MAQYKGHIIVFSEQGFSPEYMFERTDPEVYHGPLRRGERCPFNAGANCPTVMWKSKAHAKYEGLMEFRDGDILRFASMSDSKFDKVIKKVRVNPNVPPYEYGISWVPKGIPFSHWLSFIDGEDLMLLIRKEDDGDNYQI